MVAILIALIGLGLLAVNELLWRRYKKANEFSRKFVHITVGCFVASWPYFLSWNAIRLLGLAALVVVIVSKYFNIFQTIHSVTRTTWGEALFAVSVILMTYVTHSPSVFAVAFLQVGLADAIAALVGTSKLSEGNGYKVFGATKSLAGSGAFFVTSYLILLSLSVFSAHIAIFTCLGIAAVATVLENVSVRGLDNVVVPIAVAVMLQAIS